MYNWNLQSIWMDRINRIILYRVINFEDFRIIGNRYSSMWHLFEIKKNKMKTFLKLLISQVYEITLAIYEKPDICKSFAWE